MNPLILSLAWRMLKGTTHERSISTMALISFCSIALGVGSLALVVSIMNGFEKVTHEKMQSIHPQLFIRSDGYPINMKKLGTFLEQNIPNITAYAPNTTRTVIVAPTNQKSSIDNVVLLKGVEPRQEQQVSSLHSKITQPKPRLPMHKLLPNNQVIVGKRIAQQLKLHVGSELTIYAAQPASKYSRKITFNDHDVKVGGIFDTGIEEFDAHLIICSLEQLNILFPRAHPTEVGIKLKDGTDEDEVVEQIQQRIGLDVLSWKELYPALVSALQLEKYVMFFLLALVTLVASMNLISLLFMQITRKRKTMALLCSFGMPFSQVRSLFYCLGLMLTVSASWCGLLLAFVVGLWIDYYPFITLPDVYYVTHLPISMSWSIFVLVFIVSILLSVVGLWVPIRTIRYMKVAQVLRFES